MSHNKLSARLVVFEKTGSWAASFRRQLALQSSLIRETRSDTDLSNELQQHPGSIVALEARDEALSLCANRLLRLQSSFPQCRFLVLLSRQAASHHWLFRELGAVGAIASPLDLRRARPLIQRCLAGQKADDLTVEIVDQLPWGE